MEGPALIKGSAENDKMKLLSVTLPYMSIYLLNVVKQVKLKPFS